jgi:hypothetical protein
LTNILTPDSYMKTVKELYNTGGKADECPLYIVIYETVYSICKEQYNIVDSGADLLVLLSTLGALPCLIEVGLSFYETIELDDALLSSLTLDIVVVEESYKYYI